MRAWVSFVVSIAVLPAVASSAGRGVTGPVASRPAKARLQARSLPLQFEQNRGQTDPRVRFLSRGPGFTVYLTNDALALSLANDERAVSNVRIALAGAKPTRISGTGDVAGRSNYLTGRDPNARRISAENYSKVRYQDVYPDIDLVLSGEGRQLEYDFVLAPHAHPDVIRLAVDGGELSLDDSGNLRIGTASGSVLLSRPHVYQEIERVRKEVAGEYRAIGPHEIGFTVGAYDESQPLVIDPVLAYSTYLGGSDWDFASDLKVDSSGSAYICGYTASLNFPTTAGQTASGGSYDAFVAKIRTDGSLDFATYLGGSGFEACSALAIDASGAVYVTGATTSTDFPVVGALQPTSRGGLGGDAFLTKIDPSGSSLTYSTHGLQYDSARHHQSDGDAVRPDATQPSHGRRLGRSDSRAELRYDE